MWYILHTHTQRFDSDTGQGSKQAYPKNPQSLWLLTESPGPLFPCRSLTVAVTNFTYEFFLTLSCWRTSPYVRRDSSVGIATRYRVEGPGIESRWGARYSGHVQTGPGARPASYTMGFVSLSRGEGVKRPGRGVDHRHASSRRC
jgi:hypothetical protein